MQARLGNDAGLIGAADLAREHTRLFRRRKTRAAANGAVRRDRVAVPAARGAEQLRVLTYNLHDLKDDDAPSPG